jgi:hypothetical protein
VAYRGFFWHASGRLNRGVKVFRAWLVAASAIAFCAETTEAKRDVPSPRARAALRAAFLESLTPLQPLDDTAWVLSGLSRSQRYRLTPSETLPWLERYVRPSQNHTPEWRRYWDGRYGQRSWRIGPTFRWGNETESSPESSSDEFELRELSRVEPLSLEGVDVAPLWPLEVANLPEPEEVSITKAPPCPRWRAPRALTVMRYAGESDRFALLDCDGAVSADALDRLSVLARPPEVPRPELPLPFEPEAGDEWLPEVRLLDPRLVWLVQQLGQAFPGRAIVIYSGYRRDAHSGFHQKGRALDLQVYGVPNEQVFAFCKSLRDVGCGYYPESKFVHVDVRPYGTKRVLWVDVSKPGAPSRYVDGWPGVLEPGVAWLGR